MASYDIDGENNLHYVHHPAADGGVTFVSFNALTGDTAMWEAPIGEALRQAGHGVLAFNFRGQQGSAFAPGAALTPDLIVEDAGALLAHMAPERPVFVGLSIGGLFAAQVHLAGRAGTEAIGLVLINTLRKDGARLRWINDAVVRAAEVGGLELFRDLYVPLLFAEPWLSENRGGFLKAPAYAPIDPAGGPYNLLKHSGAADWDLPYEELNLPVLVMTGLEDHVFLDPKAVAELSARMPDARRLDFDAGHLLPAEDPAAVTAALLDFAAGLSITI